MGGMGAGVGTLLGAAPPPSLPPPMQPVQYGLLVDAAEAALASALAPSSGGGPCSWRRTGTAAPGGRPTVLFDERAERGVRQQLRAIPGLGPQIVARVMDALKARVRTINKKRSWQRRKRARSLQES